MLQLVVQLLLALNFSFTFAIPLSRAADPTAQLDSATVTGKTSGVVSEFLGIPYALSTGGNRRFRLPEPVPPYTSNFHAQDYGIPCPAQAEKMSANGVNLLAHTSPGPDPEDCLTINVITPSNTTVTSKLPVAVWIYGGAFANGNTSSYDGSVIVKRSIELDQPIIYASMNYRVTAFGFLVGKEAKDAGAGNLGLQDQRLALRWIQKYIPAFGGDPTKVTLWGESAGAVSVALQMVTNGGNTEGLFRAGFMQSGAPVQAGDMTNGQRYYDSIVEDTGCTNATSTLDCLRQVDYPTIKAAIDNTPGVLDYQSIALPWLPRADGRFLTENPMELVQRGTFAKVPFVSGNCDDEGTLFAFSTLNITTSAQFEEWLRLYWLQNITDSEMAKLLEYYPEDVTKGSPYDTGSLNALTPQFKRIASFQGDAVFQAPRRHFFEYAVGRQPVWSYISKRGKATPNIGAAHASDISNIYGPGDLTDYLVHFVNTLDPNGSGITPWPKYTLDNRTLLRLSDEPVQRDLQLDDYRVEEMKYLNTLFLRNPI